VMWPQSIRFVRSVVCSSAVALLLFAIIAPAVRRSADPPNQARMLLRDSVPRVLPGWRGQDLPLGPSEFVSQHATRLLAFDDYVYREYRNGTQFFTVYVAFWNRSDNVGPREVAEHIPDNCWVSNGWKCEQARHAVPLPPFADSLATGEWRVFSHLDQPLMYVQYWHLVGQDLYPHVQRYSDVTAAWNLWSRGVTELFRGPSDQLFVRIAANADFENFADNPGWRQMIETLGGLGLKRRSHAP
jgi:hypothetical protein